MGNESQSCKRVAASDDHRSIPLLILMSGPVCVGNNMLVCGVVHCPTALNPFRGSCTLHIVHDLKAGRRVCAGGKNLSAFDTLYRTQAAYDQQKDHTRDDDGSFGPGPRCACADVIVSATLTELHHIGFKKKKGTHLPHDTGMRIRCLFANATAKTGKDPYKRHTLDG